MKTLIATALTASVLFAGAASATTAPRLSPEALRYLPNAETVALTDTQIHQINAAVHAGGNYNEKRSVIRSLAQ
ncbi:hypothetical protein J4E08_17790 [Sagittula sp. NFXS13]|uniref:Uncharacterized protein n=1 Tax=Sagittula marina TaxID=943940 RepID=A0A7W6DVZ8_9RHOB|nr:hypothetical protein [Sagittula marina]MBB3986309.1 hypothetical protein [Sagittula marina]